MHANQQSGNDFIVYIILHTNMTGGQCRFLEDDKKQNYQESKIWQTNAVCQTEPTASIN